MIRKAEICDADAMAKCHHDAILAISSEFYSQTQIEAWASGTTPNKYHEPIKNGEMFLIEEIDGLGAFGWLKTNPPEIRAIYTSPSYQKQGLGAKLLNYLEQRLIELGATEIMLGASLNALSFYEKRGYDSGARTTIEIGGISSPMILMTKKLN